MTITKNKFNINLLMIFLRFHEEELRQLQNLCHLINLQCPIKLICFMNLSGI